MPQILKMLAGEKKAEKSDRKIAFQPLEKILLHIIFHPEKYQKKRVYCNFIDTNQKFFFCTHLQFSNFPL